MTTAEDWRRTLLAGAAEVGVPELGRDPARWPGYVQLRAVSVWRLPAGPVAVCWDFNRFGGSFGEDDATALAAGVQEALRLRTPLVTLVRSGGTRLQEGMHALVGIPRARLALLDLAAAGLPHLSVADAPTTGGVWVGVTARADVRVAVVGATVAFAGPRVVEAVTGSAPRPGSHTAESAFAAGLVDALLEPGQLVGWLQRAVTALAVAGPTEAVPVEAGAVEAGAVEAGAVEAGRGVAPPVGGTGAQRAVAGSGPQPPAAAAGVDGWAQVQRTRARTTSGGALLSRLLPEPVHLRASGGDAAVAAAVGRPAWSPAGDPLVVVALAAGIGVRPGPQGFRLAARALQLADRMGYAAVCLVDTPGAEPGEQAEDQGLAAAIGEALDALLLCRSPTVTLVHGEGGSGGAVALACADRVLVTARSYFAPIGPEGASAALRRPAEQCARLMRLTPADLMTSGFADAIVHESDLGAALHGHLDDLRAHPPRARQATRHRRWSQPLPAALSSPTT